MVCSPLIRAPANVASCPRAACPESKPLGVSVSERRHRVEKPGGSERGWESRPRGQGLAGLGREPTPSSLCYPVAGPSYFPIYSQFPQPPSRSLPCRRHCLVWADAKARFPVFSLHPSSSHCPRFPGATSELPDLWTEVPPHFFSPHFFFAQGPSVVSLSSLPDDWVQWTRQAGTLPIIVRGTRVGLPTCARRLRIAHYWICSRACLPCCVCRLPRTTSHLSTGPGTRQEAHTEPVTSKRVSTGIA